MPDPDHSNCESCGHDPRFHDGKTGRCTLSPCVKLDVCEGFRRSGWTGLWDDIRRSYGVMVPGKSSR